MAELLQVLAERNPGRVACRIAFADEVVGQADLAAVREFPSGQ